MLPKQNKLQLRKHQTFFSSARKKHSNHFVLFVAPGSKTTKIAVIIPAKKVQTAVARNHHKRVIKAALLALVKNELTQNPMNIVVYLKKHFTEKTFTFKTVQQELQTALKAL